MGTEYTIILMDEFDWDYVGTNKEEKLKAFEEKLPKLTRQAAWFRYAVYEGKVFPLHEPNKEIILAACDAAFWSSELEPWKIERLEKS